jgi:hypothetical protein
MRGPAIDLDDQTLGGPGEVDGVMAHMRVHLRLGKAVAATECEKAPLKLGPGLVRPEPIADREVEELGLPQGGGELPP